MIKSIVILSSCMICLATSQAQSVQPSSVTLPDAEVLLLKETSYHFGKIPQGKPVTHVFELVNTGKEPLVLENVQASCGCTTPEWSRQPIEPGGSQKITVGYNAAAEGPFEKSINIFYRSGKIKTILIKGEVWKTPDQPAPKNNSLSILKNLN